MYTCMYTYVYRVNCGLLSLSLSLHMQTATNGPTTVYVHEVVQVSSLTVAICSVAGKYL